MNEVHWGEIPENKEQFVPDISADIERSMNKFCLAEFENDNFDSAHKSQQIMLSSMDPLMLYAITLHKYANDICEMIRVAELAIESNVTPPEDAVPPMAEMPEIRKYHKQNSFNLNSQQSLLYPKDDLEVPELSDAVVKQILAKCVATMFAHIGYESTHQSVLDVLVDVLQEFLKKICYRYKLAMEDESIGRLFGFPNTIERVLTETGLGGVKGLHDYYNTRVIKYIPVLQERCKSLKDHYEKILIPKNVPQSDKMNKFVRPKAEEENVVRVDNEVHLPNADSEFALSSLETGFQLLNRFEAETNLQTLGEEDMNVYMLLDPKLI